MNHSVCTTSWCDQGTRPHERHELTLGTWRGTAHTAPRRPVDAQLVIHGLDDTDAAPMLVLVDQLHQTDVVLTWEQLVQIAAQSVHATIRFRAPA